MSDPELDYEEDPGDLPDVFEAPDRGLPLAPPPAAEGEPLPVEGCIRCGNSCRSIYLWQGDLGEFKERDTKKWVDYHEVETFTKDMPDGKTFWGIKLDKPCKHLIETGPSEFGCAIYDRRPYVCRIYKGINPDGPQPGCGFNREVP
ncbi:MAG: YkgJ family cysteine cluster protein [Planctomycetes bacterium]|nr:YkgJ family cysteine cluster protein [Planctomycetota bacterium]